MYVLNILATISYDRIFNSEYARTWLKTMDLVRQGKLTDAHAKLTEAGLETGVWLAILPSKDTARQKPGGDLLFFCRDQRLSK